MTTVRCGRRHAAGLDERLDSTCYDGEVRLAVLVLLGCCGCSGVGEALLGSCLAASLQVGVELACQVCSTAVCGGGDGDDDDDDHASTAGGRAELGPELTSADDDAPAADIRCRLQLDDGQALRLGCVDGTSAVSLGEPSEARQYPGGDAHTVDGDVWIRSADDVAGLAGVRAITGSLRVTSDVLLRVRLPSLRSVGGDVVVAGNPRLLRLELGSLVDVGGALIVKDNAALSADPVPQLARAARVDVIGNEALPVVVVDRLLALPL